MALKLHVKPHSLTVGDFNTPLSPMDRSGKQKINREMRELTDFMTQMDLTDTLELIELFMQTQKNISSLQHFLEPSQRLTT